MSNDKQKISKWLSEMLEQKKQQYVQAQEFNNFSSEADSQFQEQISEIENVLSSVQNMPDATPEDEDYKTRFSYLAADFENYKRRTARDLDQMTKKANQKLLKQMVDVVDDFDRVLQSTNDQDALGSGVRIIKDKYLKILEESGCTPMPCGKGSDFDPQLHEAVCTKPCEKENDAGKIAEVFSSGWMLHGSLLKAAKVVVFAEQS